MEIVQFSAGTMFAQRKARDGSVTDVVEIGSLQDGSIDFTWSQKMLNGANQFAIAVANGTAQVALKASTAIYDAVAYNEIFFGNSTGPIVGRKENVLGEQAMIPLATTYTVTVAQATDWSDNRGVKYSNGKPFHRVASNPAAGEFSVAAGIYTFSAEDAGQLIFISYQCTYATGGSILTINNNVQGSQVFFMCELQSQYGDAGFEDKVMIHLEKCVTSKLSFSTKQADFIVPQFEATAMVGAGNVVGFMSFPDAHD